jgi:hypothetical protein
LHSLPATSETGAAWTYQRGLRRDEASSRGRSRSDSGLRRGGGGTDPDRDRWRWLRGMYCARRLEPRGRGGDAEVTGSQLENYMLSTPLPPGRGRAWSNPATWSCRCGGCCAPRQRVSTVTKYRPGLEDLYLPSAKRRRAGDQLGPPGVRSPGRSAAWFPSRAWPSTPADVATWGGDFGSGCTGRSLSPCPAPSSNSARSAARGRWLPRARGASRGHRSAADAGRPPPPLGPG